jgi:hypothetical protein
MSLHSVVVLHDFAGKNQTQMLHGSVVKLGRNLSLELKKQKQNPNRIFFY